MSAKRIRKHLIKLIGFLTELIRSSEATSQMLFIVQHTHSESNCPARDPEQGNMLLQHINQNAAHFGVTINAEGVANGKHQFHLIVESDSQENVERFMTPFKQAGQVEILPASPCEVVVDRGAC